MAGRNVLARIDDMLGAIEAIYTLEQGTEALPVLRRLATERAFEIVSEASRHIPEAIKETEPSIPWKRLPASETCCGTTINP